MKNKETEILFLERWLKNINIQATKISLNAKHDNVKSFFLISTTGKRSDNSLPYTTPIRHTEFGWLAGTVVFSQIQTILAVSKLDGIVDYIFVDAEKKLGVTLNKNREILDHFNISHLVKDDSNNYIEFGNISGACSGIIKTSIYHEYKPNDLTVEAAWTFISNYFRGLSGKKMAIIGGGNIGFKLGLKLVESGVNIEFVRRTVEKGRLLVKAINYIKPESTIATAHYNSDPIQASINCDALLGTTNGIEIITWEMIQSMNSGGIVLDIGKGTINKDTAKKAVSSGIKILRCDISSALSGTISTIIRNMEIANNKMGRMELLKDIYIVSGGYFALEGDIVVDNINNPQIVYGISDGKGNIVIILNENQKRKLKKLQKFII